MEGFDPPPLALLAWLARCRRAGFAAEPLLAELGLGADVLADPRLAALEAAWTPEEELAGPDRLLAAAADQLLAQGRVGEAARLRPARRAGPSRGGEAAVDESLEAMLADPEARAEWEAMDYANWVVPPGSDRRPLASLTAEWVTPAERWRVLEELRRIDDPAEHARVLDHFRRAGLDPGADHPAWARPAAGAEPAAGQAGEREGDRPAGAGRVEPGRAAPAETAGTVADACAGGSDALREGCAPVRSAEEATGIDPEAAARRAFLVRLGQEAEAYFAAGRARREAEAWQRYARELGVPVPPHARLVPPDEPSPSPAAPEPAVRLPEAEPWPLCPDWHGRPRDPRTGKPLAEPAAPPPPAPPAWPAGLGPRPPEPVPDWPWPAGDGIPPEDRARAEARAPRPAPSGKTSRPKAPAAEGASGRRRHARRSADPPARAPSPDPPAPAPATPAPPAAPSAPVVWAKQPLTPFRLARIRGDYPWWL